MSDKHVQVRELLSQRAIWHNNNSKNLGTGRLLCGCVVLGNERITKCIYYRWVNGEIDDDSALLCIELKNSRVREIREAQNLHHIDRVLDPTLQRESVEKEILRERAAKKREGYLDDILQKMSASLGRLRRIADTEREETIIISVTEYDDIEITEEG